MQVAKGIVRRLLRWRQTCQSPVDRPPVDHPKPRSVVLAPRNFRGYVTIKAARRGEGQVTANKCWALLPELEPSSFRSQRSHLEFGEKLMNSFLASHEPSVAEV